MRTEGMDQVREALKAFSEDGKRPVTVVTLSKALGLETESQKQVLRKRLNMLVDRGEATRPGFGEYCYLPGSEPNRFGESYRRMWKIIRVQTPGWDKGTIAAITRYDRSTIERYVNWLEGQGYIARHGRKGNKVLWRTTARGQEERNTPLMPVRRVVPYATEKAAAAGLCTLMLTADLDQQHVKMRIARHLVVLMARFEKYVTQHENAERGENSETEEASC